MSLNAVQPRSIPQIILNPQLEISGGRSLSGELHVSGAKNSALVLMAACYDRLKLPEQATTARQVYTANYNEPTPNWEAVSKQRSWYQFWKQR